ncbi:MAG: hypothetical protein NTZ25_03145 [Candidatus Peregrinibacteria bacterium]|nr:hypothetical protein [Candidatus Peregrinibacteria bacterium]
MENRLIYKNSPPEVHSEKPEQIGDGKQAYERLIASIKNLDVKAKQDPVKLQQTMAQIIKIYSDLGKTENGVVGSFDGGNFFMKLFQQTRDAFDLKAIAASSDYNKTIVQRLGLLADPDVYANQILNDGTVSWNEGTVKSFANDIVTVADFYAFQNVNKSEAYAQDYLKAAYALKYSKLSGAEITDKQFQRWLTYNKDHYEIEVVNNFVNVLPDASKQKLQKSIIDLQSQAAELKTKAEFDTMFSKLGSDASTSPIVKEVLAAGNLNINGASDKNDPMYYAPQSIYLALSWAFYKSLTDNPNQDIALPAANLVHEAHNGVYDQFPELKPVDVAQIAERSRMSEETSESVVSGNKITNEAEKIAAEMATDNDSHLPDFKLGKNPSSKLVELTGSLFETESQIQNLKVGIIQGIDGKGQSNMGDELEKSMTALRKELKDMYGFEEIVALNPDVKNKVQESLNYYEAFAVALHNADFLPTAEKTIDESAALSEKDWATNFSDLKHVYLVLRFSSYLPKETVPKYKVLLERAKKLYLDRAIALNIPPAATTSPSPFVSKADDNFYREENNEYEYSPMIDVSTSADQSKEAFEIPEIMNKQLNRIEVIRSLATSLLRNEDDDDEIKAYADPVMKDMDSVQAEMFNYYTGDEYDGVTAFKLDEKLNARVPFRNFLFGLKNLMTPAWAKTGPSIKSADAYSSLEKIVDKKGSVHDLRTFVSQIARDGNKFKGCYDSLMQVIQGGDNVSMETIKYAGVIVVKLEREHFNDFVSSRILMAKLLQPHMAKSRNNLETHAEGYTRMGHEKAHQKASRDVRNYLGSGNNADKLISSIRMSIKQKNPDIKDADLNTLAGSTYSEFYDAMIEEQTDVLYKTFLDHAALSSNYFEFFGKADGADKVLKEDFIDSVDPDNETWNWSDEGMKIFATVTKELAINGLAMLTGMIAGSAIARVLRYGKLLLNLERFATIGRTLERGISLVSLGTEALVFHDVVAGLKGEKSLESLWKNGDYANFALGLAGETAFFGVAKGISWLNSFKKQGAVGRGLMKLAISNPEMSEMVEKTLAAAATKNSEEAVLALENIMTRGVKLTGRKTYQKLPAEVSELVKDGVKDLSLMREQYGKLIQSLPGKADSPIKKVCGFLLQDLQFDALSMVLGSAARNMIVPEDMKRKMDLMSGETWMEMYTMAAAFRGAFTVVKVGGQWVHKKLGAEVPEETLPALRTSEKELLKHLELLDETSSVRTKVQERLSEVQAAIAKIETELSGPRKLGDFLVPSNIARLMPRWLRQHFYNHYVDKQGNFLGSDGLRDVLLGMSKDQSFSNGVELIRSSKRLLLSTNQVLVVASKLADAQRTEFLEACAPKMTRMQTRFFMDTVEAMEIKDVPDSFKPKIDTVNNPTALQRMRVSRWQEALMGPLQVLALASALNGNPKFLDKPTERPGIVSTISAGEFGAMSEAKAGSKFVVTEGVKTKEWSPEKAKDIFTKDANADEAAIIKDLEKSNAPKDVVDNIRNIFDNLPDAIKPYVRIFANADVNNKAPYVLVDQEGFMSVVRSEMENMFNDYKDMGLVKASDHDTIMAQIAPGKVMQAGFPWLAALGMMTGLFKVWKRPTNNVPGIVLGVWYAAALGHTPIPGWVGDVVDSIAGAAIPFPHNMGISWLLPLLMVWRSKKAWELSDKYGLTEKLGLKKDPNSEPGKTGSGEKPKEIEHKPGVEVDKDKLPGLIGKGNILEGGYPNVDDIYADTTIDVSTREALKTKNTENQKSLAQLHEKLRDLFSTRLRFKTEKEGQNILSDSVKWEYANLRTKELTDILDISTLDPKLKAKYEHELETLSNLRNELKPKIAAIPESIAYVSDAGRVDMANLAQGYIDVEMRARGFDSKEIKPVKSAIGNIVNLLHRYPDIMADIERVRVMDQRLQALKPSYEKAKKLTETPLAPNSPLITVKAFEDAENTVKLFEGLKQTHDRETGDVKGIKNKLKLSLAKALPSSPTARKLVLGAIAATLAASMYFGWKITHPEVPKPPKPPSESEKQKEKDDKTSVDESMKALEGIMDDEPAPKVEEVKDEDLMDGEPAPKAEEEETPKETNVKVNPAKTRDLKSEYDKL